jgi:DnaJ family protein C protein 28
MDPETSSHEHDAANTPEAPNTLGQPPRKPARLAWFSYVEEQIRAAQERGAFDNLPGSGRPLDLDENPWAGDRALAYHLLKSHNVLPPEVALGKEVDTDLARAEESVAALRRRRDHLLGRRLPPFPSERRAYNVLRAKTEQRYEEALRAINSKTLTLNITAPSALHRRAVDVEARLRAFRVEFPPLAE